MAEQVTGSGLIVAGRNFTAAATPTPSTGPIPTDQSEARRMAVQRLRNQRVAYASSSSARSTPNLSFATMRPHDPLWYWQQNNLLFDIYNDDDLKRLRKICRQVVVAHPVMGPAVDIFSKWPLTGMEFAGKDSDLNEFYTTLFFEQLNYYEYLPLVGREYWGVGEAFSLGSFNETLGVWDDDELIQPDDVTVEVSPFLKDPRFFIELPESLKKILRSGQPKHEYDALVRSYPELKHFLSVGRKMPVSNVLMKHLKFTADAFATRGVPIMYRALRALTQEEMLNSAQDAIADRLYTPLLLAKIGASAADLGTEQPWVPTPDQITDFEASMDMALAADFRLLTTHFAVDVSSVFGREIMPDFGGDYDRITDLELQVFGLSKTMLSGADAGQTYAADAMNRDLITQLLTDYQRRIKRFVRDRALVVAEAQEHYDYEVRNGKRYPVMEEVLVVDEETGEQKVVEQPKLLVPDLHLQVMNMKDDETQRAFFEQLRAAGVPISMETRLINIPINLDDEIEKTRQEQVRLAVEEQVTRRETYQQLRDQGLPIPEDLAKDFGPKAIGSGGSAAPDTRNPELGVDVTPTPNLAPTPQDVSAPAGTPVDQQGSGDEGATVIQLPTNKVRHRPPESDEQRARMPKPSMLTDSGGSLLTDDDGEPIEARLVNGPAHIGRRLKLDPEKPIEEQEDAQLAE